MPWARLDDGLLMHPKFADLDPAVIGLWAMGLVYCAKHLTDGFIPRDMVPRLLGIHPSRTRKLAAVLVARGLWEEVDGGYQIHDYLDWNDSADDVREKRKAAKRRKERHQARYAERRENAVRNAPRTPSGTGPTPYHTTENPSVGSPSRASMADELPQDRVSVRPDGSRHMPPGADAWVHHDGCPRTEHLDRFPPELRRQCREHRSTPSDARESGCDQ